MKQLSHDHYVIVYGGKNLFIDNRHVIYVATDDGYCGLVEKIHYAYKHIKENIKFDFLVKFDRSVYVKKLLDQDFLKDYSGIILSYSNIDWHFNRCDPESKWYNRSFLYDPILYCVGLCYVLSYKSVSFIAEDNLELHNHVYEDLYVGSVMLKNNIYPQRFSFKISKYFYDADHKILIQKYEKFLKSL